VIPVATTATKDLDRATQDLTRILRRAPFAAVGAGEAIADFAQTIPERTSELTSRFPYRFRQRFDSFADRGERLTDQALTSTRKRVSQLRGQGKQQARKARSQASNAVEPPTGTGPYDSRTVDELRELAADKKVEGRSSMTKKQLIKALRAT
jgi:hypothetical protein